MENEKIIGEVIENKKDFEKVKEQDKIRYTNRRKKGNTHKKGQTDQTIIGRNRNRKGNENI